MKSIKVLLFWVLVLSATANTSFLNAQCIVNDATGSCSGGNGSLTDGCTINPGDYYWYSGTGSVSNILIKGGTLVVCGELTIDQSLNWNGGLTVIVDYGASLTFTQSVVNMQYRSTIINYGQIHFSNDLSLQGTPSNIFIKDRGIMNVNGTLSLNGTSQISNSGVLSASNLIIQTSISPAICMLPDAKLSFVSITNNRLNSISAPIGDACISYTGNAHLNQPLSNTPNLILCVQPGSTISSTGDFGSATIINPCTNCSVALPIELIYFSATAADNRTVILEWQTASEKNNDYFTIERSLDGINWEEVIKISGAGNSSSVLNYYAYDNNPYSEQSYYRLKQTDFDGAFEYSEVISVGFNKAEINNITIYPNPVENEFILIGNSVEIRQIRLFNSLGQDITSKAIIKKQSDTGVVVDLTCLSPGLYYVKTLTTSNIVYKQ